MSWIERELKLRPADESLLDALESLGRLGPFAVVQRRAVRQRTAYLDTRTGALQTARIAFRRRVSDGAALATWTLKAEGLVSGSVASRPEIEVALDEDTPPPIALSVLEQAARSRGAADLAEQVHDALAGSPPPSRIPVVELDADRRLADLIAAEPGWQVELALDRVRIVGIPDYLDLEVEVELKSGDDATLEAAEAAIARIGPVTPSPSSKLSRALAYLGARQRA